jgi:hypothetical protein
MSVQLHDLHGSFLLANNTPSQSLSNVLSSLFGCDDSGALAELVRSALLASRVLAAIRRVQLLAGDDLGAVRARVAAAPSETEANDEMARFRASIVAKDCSVMIAARRLAIGVDETHAPTAADYVIGVRDRRFAVRVAVVDLDDKSHNSLEHYIDIDREIVQSFEAQLARDASVQMQECAI